MHQPGIRIVCIVEGEGEMQAVPRLVKRRVKFFQPDLSVQTSTVLASRGDFPNQDMVKRLVRSAAIELQGPGGILIMFDSDGACPATLGPKVHAWARRAAGTLPVGLVVAHHEYEAWLLAGANALGSVAHLRKGLRAPASPESFQDPKGWLSTYMPTREQYSPTRHQAILTEHFDLQQARDRAPSFAKCLREIDRIITTLQPSSTLRSNVGLKGSP